MGLSSQALCIHFPWEAVSPHLLGLQLHPGVLGQVQGGEGWGPVANGDVFVPCRTSKLLTSLLSFLLPQARELTKEEKEELR